MNKKKILILSVLAIFCVGMTMGSACAASATFSLTKNNMYKTKSIGSGDKLVVSYYYGNKVYFKGKKATNVVLLSGTSKKYKLLKHKITGATLTYKYKGKTYRKTFKFTTRNYHNFYDTRKGVKYTYLTVYYKSG